MSDLESYLVHCYDLLLHSKESRDQQVEEEECACRTLIDHNDNYPVTHPTLGEHQ